MRPEVVNSYSLLLELGIRKRQGNKFAWGNRRLYFRNLLIIRH